MADGKTLLFVGELTPCDCFTNFFISSNYFVYHQLCIACACVYVLVHKTKCKTRLVHNAHISSTEQIRELKEKKKRQFFHIDSSDPALLHIREQHSASEKDR